MKKSKIIGTIFSAICFILCLIISVEVIVANSEQRPPRFFGYSISYVPTNSMEPKIMAGDYILFYEASFDDVDVDDIIIYRSKEGIMAGNFIVHRVKEKYSDYLITKGDFNTISDSEKITPDMVFGKFVTTISVLNLFSSPTTRTLVFVAVVLTFIIMIALQFIAIFINYKKEKIELENKIKKEKMLEELKIEILKEELEKFKNNNMN